MTTRISYETARKLKEFLGESAPEPMDDKYFIAHSSGKIENCNGKLFTPIHGEQYFPRYSLHDLLSKPFCEALENIGVRLFSHTIVLRLSNMYYDGGLPAVERSLMEMMK